MSEHNITDTSYIFPDSENPRAEASCVCEAAVSYGDKDICPDPNCRYTLDDYYALPDNIRAELIDGTFFIMESPSVTHQVIGGEIYHQLVTQIEANHGSCLPLIAPTDVQLDCDNKTMVEPDVLLVCDRDKVKNRCICGAPDFVAEVLSPSTRKKDMYLKLWKYRNAGVREYWMINPKEKKVIIYDLENEKTPRIVGFDCEVTLTVCEGKISIDLRRLEAACALISD